MLTGISLVLHYTGAMTCLAISMPQSLLALEAT